LRPVVRVSSARNEKNCENVITGERDPRELGVGQKRRMWLQKRRTWLKHRANVITGERDLREAGVRQKRRMWFVRWFLKALARIVKRNVHDHFDWTAQKRMQDRKYY